MDGTAAGSVVRLEEQCLKPVLRHEVRFAVLGPVRAWRGETEIDLGPPLRRALLALLLVQAGRPVAIADIVTALWGRDPPATAINQVHSHVGTLRRLIEPGLPPRSAGRWLLRSAGGYRLDVNAGCLDLLLYRQLWQQARQVTAGRPDQAVQLAMQAMELWHGPVADGVDWPAGAHPAVAALDREYLLAARDAADLALLAGVPGRVLTIVQEAAARVPFDEPVQARLVRVLAATGARAEALRVYRAVAALLADELGLDPGPELRAAQKLVLRVEPELGRPEPPTAIEVSRPAHPEPAGSGRSAAVRTLLADGARVGPTDPHTASPLRAAVLQARHDVVRSLITHGALATEPAARSSVLAEAVSYTAFRPGPAAVETLRVLLDAGAVPGPRDEAPLITAVMRLVAPAVLRLLLDHGADPNQRRSDATPAIVVAARRGDHAAVDVLLQAGADVDARDGQGRTALMHAVERNEQRVAAALLLASAAIDTVSVDGMTAMRLARGWQRQNIQCMLGEDRVSLDNVPIVRTVVRVVPTAVQLVGDRRTLHLLASVIDIALDDLGDDAWQTRTGTHSEQARAFAARLRDVVPAANASWHQLDATADELATTRSALVELACGTTRVLPSGSSRLEIVDLLEELDRQLGR
jgi:DNA-binding SARP family transcriptional activator/ankyrin repeat protein